MRTEKLIAECDKHLARINHAYVKMAVFMPLDAAKYQVLGNDEVEHIDQFLFRFAKLQDAIGENYLSFCLSFCKKKIRKTNLLSMFLTDWNSWLCWKPKMFGWNYKKFETISLISMMMNRNK